MAKTKVKKLCRKLPGLLGAASFVITGIVLSLLTHQKTHHKTGLQEMVESAPTVSSADDGEGGGETCSNDGQGGWEDQEGDTPAGPNAEAASVGVGTKGCVMACVNAGGLLPACQAGCLALACGCNEGWKYCMEQFNYDSPGQQACVLAYQMSGCNYL